MSTITYMSSARTIDLPATYAPYCGEAPEVITWARGMGKGSIGVICRNPRCPNHIGVLAGESDIREKWERFRVEGT